MSIVFFRRILISKIDIIFLESFQFLKNVSIFLATALTYGEPKRQMILIAWGAVGVVRRGVSKGVIESMRVFGAQAGYARVAWLPRKERPWLNFDLCFNSCPCTGVRV